MRVLSESGSEGGIGRLNEKTLHKILKLYIEPDESFHEIKFLGKVADIKTSSRVFEIQTGALEKMNPKLEVFLKESPVTLVLPLAAKKSVSWVADGNVSPSRKSPKSEGVFDALLELSKISKHFCDKNLTVKLLFLDVSDYRYLNGWDRSKKRGSTRCDRIPNAIIKELDISSKEDVLALMGTVPSGEFLAKDFAKITKKTSRKNYYILRFLQDIGALSKVREEKRAFIYKFN